jgi:hypothetical protein
MFKNLLRLPATTEASSATMLAGGLVRAAAFDPLASLSKAGRNSKHLLAVSKGATNTNTHWHQWLAELTQILAGTVGRG